MSSTQFVPACASELEPFSKLDQQSKIPIVGMRLWAFILRPSLISNFNLNFKFLILNFLCHLCVFTVSRVEKGGKIQLKSCAGRLLYAVLWQHMELCSEDEIDMFTLESKLALKLKGRVGAKKKLRWLNLSQTQARASHPQAVSSVWRCKKFPNKN